MTPLNPELDRSQLSYNVEDESLASLIQEFLGQLEPYENRDLLREIVVTAAKLAEQGASRGDVKILRTSIKELRYAFKVFQGYRGVPKVTVFGSARSRPEDPEYQTAMEFSRRIAEKGYMVITGAGGGIMAAGNAGAGREQSFGLNIMLPFEQVANPTIQNDSKLINFHYFFTRKLFFIKESDAVVLLPGGFGTMDEGFEALTLVQTGKDAPTPIVMLDRPGGTYWTNWREFVRANLLERGLISKEDGALFKVTDDIDEACSEIETFYRRYHSCRYVNRKQILVLRLKEPLGPDQVARLNTRFADILVDGKIEPCEPFPEEQDEPHLLQLPRLSLPFDQRHFARLRQLIDAINE